MGAASFRDRYIKLRHPHNISLLAVIFGPCSTFNFCDYSSWCFNAKTETKVLITYYFVITRLGVLTLKQKRKFLLLGTVNLKRTVKKESSSWIDCRSCFRLKHSEFLS